MTRTELRRSQWRALIGVLLVAGVAVAVAAAAVAAAPNGAAATAAPAAGAPPADWTGDAPGRRHSVHVGDLPKPFATASSTNFVKVVPRPADAQLHVPAGFRVAVLVGGLTDPRALRVAPNGDIFVAESKPGRVRVIRAANGQVQTMEVFATGLEGPFGMAFYPAGADPQWLYVANENSLVRYAYRNGDLKARGPAETLVAQLAPHTGGHVTRDLAFTRDGKRLLVSVGSGSNYANGLPAKTVGEIRTLEAAAGRGALWGDEERRADILAFDPDGHPAGQPAGHAFATGLRNCVSMAVHPTTGDLWCVTNERDGLGDDLVPDYVTRVPEGAFFGWPWYYLGSNRDPRLPDTRQDLRGHVNVPDVLLQAHSAPLGITFWRGDAYVASHGSWNRSLRTGYKVIRIPLKDGVPVGAGGAGAAGANAGANAGGEYEDFLTGFVVDGASVWGRPVGLAPAADGALLVTDDGSGTVWRVVATGLKD